jgi:hypothetical protein
MLEDWAGSKNPEAGQVTLMHLFLCIAFFMPVAAATTERKRSGGGTLRCLVPVPSALVLGAVIVSLDWRLGKALWLRCQRYSKQAQMQLPSLYLRWNCSGLLLGASRDSSWRHLSQNVQ